MHQGAVMKIIKNDEAVSPVKTVSTEDAVSPVIGVILMVAITVILAAVIAAFVFGMAGSTQTTRTVGMTVSLDKDSDSAVNIQFTGGADLSSISYLVLNYDNVPVDFAAVDDVSSPKGETGVDNLVNADIVSTPNRIEFNSGATNAITKFSVGQVVNAETGNDISGHKITVIGYFTDGGSQILYDRTL